MRFASFVSLALIALPQVAAGQSPAVARVDSIAHSIMRERRIPGMQVAVVQRGAIVVERAYGVANVEHQVPVSASTAFEIASATKSFTGVAVMQLVEEGKLDLAAPISRYVDSLPASWRGLTIRQLLSHTTGLPDMINPNTGELLAPDEATAWARVQTLPLQGPPGVAFSYNQTNYALITKAIANVSGRMPMAFIAERQFKPVGMTSAGFGGSRDVRRGRATTYTYFRIVGSELAPSDSLLTTWAIFPPMLRTAAGIHTSAGDLARWIVALQRGDLLKDRNSITTMWTAGTLSNGTAVEYAMGWPLIARPAHRAVAGIGGGKAAFFVYPDDDLSVVVLTNLQGSSPHTFVDRIAAVFVPDIGAARR